MDCWRLAPFKRPIRLSGSPRRNGLLTKVFFLLTNNYLDHLWPVERDRVREGGPDSERGLEILGYFQRPFQVFVFSAKARLTTNLKRGCVFKSDFLERKIAGYSCLWLERIIPYQVVQVYCCLSSAFSADVRKKKMTSPVLPITEPVLW